MQKAYLIAVITVIVLATGFCVLIITSLIPYYGFIGIAATGVVVVLLLCISVLMVAFTRRCLGVWDLRRRTLIAGEVIAYLTPTGELLHLSATQEAAKVAPVAQGKALPQPKRTMDRAQIMELHEKGIGLRSIADAANMTFYEVQQIYSGKKGD